MRVVVLMSTYQGARYVVEQLRSILDQLPPSGRIVVRDDGSTDGTPDTILALNDGRITLTRGPNIGFARSFLTLLAEAPEDTDMVMLADQDDVWLPHKIQRAWDHLAPLAGAPALYCSRLQLVDSDLRLLGLSPNWPRPPSLQNALTENIVTGCTAAMNVSALRLVRESDDVSLIYFHDWWCYLVVAAFGRVVFDPTPTILYRQHGSNAIGMGSGLARYLAIIKFIRKQSWIDIMYRQIRNLHKTFGDRLGTDCLERIEQYFDQSRRGSKSRLLLTSMRSRQTFLSEVLFRLLLVCEGLLRR